MSRNIAIMGAGNIATMMANTINKLDDVTLYAIASRDINKAKAFAEEFHVQHYYGSYEDLVKDDKVDLVYIATPHSHHFEQAKLCILHNKPILCEKAFMANAKQAKEILSLSKEKKIFVTEAIWPRYMPLLFTVRKLLEEDMIGEITSLTANLGYPISDVPRVQDPALAGGALLDLGVYCLHFSSMILGDEIEELSGYSTKFTTGVDSQSAITIKYKNQALALLLNTSLSETTKQGIIYGTKGYVVMDNINNFEGFTVYKNGQIILQEKAPQQITGFEYQVLESFQQIENGEIECTSVTHAQILSVMEQMDALRKAWNISYPFEVEEECL